MFGVGGRTVSKLRHYDLKVVADRSPEILILEIGTNDLSSGKPEIIGSDIEELVTTLLEIPSIRVIGICQVTPRANAPTFNAKVKILNQYVRVVVDHFSNVFCWTHQGFSNPHVHPFLADGVHFNRNGQYRLYRSYRGAILKALTML